MLRAVFHYDDGERREIKVPDGWSLMEGARQEALPGIVAECGGGAICGTCHVRVGEPWVDQLDEPEMSEVALLGIVPEGCERSRLACQILMSSVTDGIEVEVPSTQLDL